MEVSKRCLAARATNPQRRPVLPRRGRPPRASEGNADASGVAFPRYRFNCYRQPGVRDGSCGNSGLFLASGTCSGFDAGGRLGELTGADTAGAGAHAAGHASDHGPDFLQVQVPLPVGDVVSVADPVPGHRDLSAEVAVLSHSRSKKALHPTLWSLDAQLRESKSGRRQTGDERRSRGSLSAFGRRQRFPSPLFRVPSSGVSAWPVECFPFSSLDCGIIFCYLGEQPK